MQTGLVFSFPHTAPLLSCFCFLRLQYALQLEEYERELKRRGVPEDEQAAKTKAATSQSAAAGVGMDAFAKLEQSLAKKTQQKQHKQQQQPQKDSAKESSSYKAVLSKQQFQ